MKTVVGSKMNKSRINVYSKDGKYLRSFASHGTGDGQLTEPHAIAVDSQDRVYVADRTSSRVAVFDRSGKFLANWKQFGRPSGVWVDKNDMLYVADSQSDEKEQSRLQNGYPRRQREGRQGHGLYSAAGRREREDAAPERDRRRFRTAPIYAAAVQMKEREKIYEIAAEP